MNKSSKPLMTHTWLITVEMREGTNIEEIGNRLQGSITYIDGVEQVDADHMGALDLEGDENMAGAGAIGACWEVK